MQLLLAALWVSVAAAAPYDNVRVLRVLPTSAYQLEFLQELQRHDCELDFWQNPTAVNVTVDIMAHADVLVDLRKTLFELRIIQTTFIDDIQWLINRERSRKPKGSVFDWNDYHNLSSINEWMDYMVKQYPEAKRVVVGRSELGNPIRGVRVSFSNGRPGVVLEGGINPREWISPSTVAYILNEILTNHDPSTRKIVKHFDWYVVPVVNPDGYDYSRIKDRMWKKNRNENNTISSDLTKNWHLNESNEWRECSSSFPGRIQSQEVEHLSTYYRNLKEKIKIYFSFNGLAPSTYDSSSMKLPCDALRVPPIPMEGFSFAFPQELQYLGYAPGSSSAWAKEVLGVKHVFPLQLGPTSEFGFLFPAHWIAPIGSNSFKNLLSLLNSTLSTL